MTTEPLRERAPYPEAALASICEQLLDDWELTPEQIANLAKDIAGECASILDNRAEAAWVAAQERLMANGGVDDSAYRRDMSAAGRDHLLPR